MELRQLQYFLSVADSPSLSQAANVMGIAQPALGRQIRTLENELGVALFYRHGRGVQLTKAGESFRSAIAPLIRNLVQAKIDISANSAIPSGSITCGMPPSISATVGARLIKNFLEQFPAVTLHLVDGFSGYVNEWLVDGRVDIAVLNNARHSPQIETESLLEVGLFHVASRKQLPETDRDQDTITLSEVSSQRLVLPGRHHGLRRELEAAALDRGVKLNVVVEVDSLPTMFELVRSGLASTVLPHGAILAETTDPELVIRRIISPEVSNYYVVAYATNRPLTLATFEFGKALRREVRSAVAEGRLVGGKIGALQPEKISQVMVTSD